ncbi:MAG: hypothetical protein NZ700_16505 [Gemmataceae bacterium]|nr:hypothetical protein [Gemmataceae bacterium]
MRRQQWLFELARRAAESLPPGSEADYVREKLAQYSKTAGFLDPECFELFG